ncbi:hypothetical protein [Amycolatopsis sp. MtRt-6]|uniref:hypothetical protein n=1 Tax=Amycolatopsis sp. MtRt-6 TaxID=2792782 RepID=UPI001A8D6467|nr:hypothetical protein [Amycolatopsis sp. MtRt-6]
MTGRVARPARPCHLDFLVAHGEAALNEPRQPGFVDQRDGGVFDGDAAAAAGVEHGLVAADPEAAGAPGAITLRAIAREWA